MENKRSVTVVAALVREGNKFLIGQRPEGKARAGMWEFIGGKTEPNETNEEALIRECREEIGVTLDLNGVRPHYSVTYDEGFDDWYVVNADPDIGSLSLQYEEVQAVRWASEEEVLAMIDSGVFIPYFKGYISTIFSTADQYGSIRGK